MGKGCWNFGMPRVADNFNSNDRMVEGGCLLHAPFLEAVTSGDKPANSSV